MQKALLTLNEAAQMLSIGRTTLRGLITNGEIEVVRIGALVRIPSGEIQRWIDCRTTGAGIAGQSG